MLRIFLKVSENSLDKENNMIIIFSSFSVINSENKKEEEIGRYDM